MGLGGVYARLRGLIPRPVGPAGLCAGVRGLIPRPVGPAGLCAGVRGLIPRPVGPAGLCARSLSPSPSPRLVLASSPALLRRLSRDVEVRPDFLSPAEEAALLQELEPRLRRQRYQRDHWDQAIHGFREIEKSQWTEQNAAVLQRLRDVAFPTGVPQLSMVHVLDLEKTGFINPHVDSVKFCGDTIAGMCLLSGSVMRLLSEENSEDQVDLLLQRRSAYILRGIARYHFSHQILRDEESFFGSQKVPRDRRISVICRNLPVSPEQADQPSYRHGQVGSLSRSLQSARNLRAVWEQFAEPVTHPLGVGRTTAPTACGYRGSFQPLAQSC